MPNRKERGETIGGGFLIFRRGKKTNRIGVRAHSLPFEHGSYASAFDEVTRLEALHPGEKFCIFQEIQ